MPEKKQDQNIGREKSGQQPGREPRRQESGSRSGTEEGRTSRPGSGREDKKDFEDIE